MLETSVTSRNFVFNVWNDFSLIFLSVPQDVFLRCSGKQNIICSFSFQLYSENIVINAARMQNICQNLTLFPLYSSEWFFINWL